MNKKDALTLACMDSFGIYERCSDCLLDHGDLCVKKKTSKYYGMDCIEAFVQSYKDKADIPDGGDVVKKEIKKLKSKEKTYCNDCLIECLMGLLDKAGIEVV